MVYVRMGEYVCVCVCVCCVCVCLQPKKKQPMGKRVR